MMQSVSTHEVRHHQPPNNSNTPQRDVMVVYINEQPSQPTRVVSPILNERKQKNMLFIATFFMSLFFFLLLASLSLYIVFIFVFNFRTGDEESIEERNFTNLYGWPLWVLVISLSLFMISLIMFVHRYRAYSQAARRKMLFMSRQLRDGVGAQPQDESNISITTEKPSDPSTIALVEVPEAKNRPLNGQSQIVIKDNRVIPAQASHPYPATHQHNDEEAVEYIHNPNVIQ